MAAPLLVRAEESSKGEAKEAAEEQGEREMPGMRGMHGWGKKHNHQMWREFHEKMEKMAGAQEAELDALVKDIDSAKGEKKVDALAAAVKKMVEQRKQLHAYMSEFHEKCKAEMEKSEPKSAPSAAEGRKSPE